MKYSKVNLIFFSILLILVPFELESHSILLLKDKRTIDSLEENLPGMDEKHKIENYNILSEGYANYSLIKSLYYANLAFHQSIVYKDCENQVRALNNLSWIFNQYGNYHFGLECLNHSLLIAENNSDLLLEAKAYLNLGQYYKNISNYVETLDNLTKSLELYEEQDSKVNIAIVLNEIFSFYLLMNNMETAKEYAMKFLDYSLQTNNNQLIMMSYINLGVMNHYGIVQGTVKDTSLPIHYFVKTYFIAEENNNILFKNWILRLISSYYIDIGKYNLAFGCLNKSLELSEFTYDNEQKSVILTLIGHYYSRLSNYKYDLYYNQLALKCRSDWGSYKYIASSLINLGSSYFGLNNDTYAINLIHQGLDMALKSGMNYQVCNAYDKLSSFYFKKHIIDSSFKYYVLLNQANDSLMNDDNVNKVKKIQVNYEMAKKENEAKVKELSQQKYINFLLIIIIILFVITVIALLLRYLTNKKSLKKITIQKNNLDDALQQLQQKEEDLVFLNQNLENLVFIRTGELQTEIEERIKYENSLRISEEKYRMLIENIQEGVFIIQDDTFQFVNEALAEMLGYKPDEMTGLNYGSILHPDDVTHIHGLHKKSIIGETIPSESEFRVLTKEGTSFRWVNRKGGLIEYNGKVATIGTMADVTDRRIAEDQLKDSLLEKEILLKEIHHRVKNNLQIIISLLELHKNKIADKPSREIFEQSRDRIRSIAMIHEKMYQHSNLSAFNLPDYIQSLANSLMGSGKNHNYLLNVNAGDVNIQLSHAVPLALILNELMTNSIKYAKDEEKKCIIEIEAGYVEPENIQLTIKDNGKGLPENFDFRKSPTFGLKLVNMLVNQLHGTLDYKNHEGSNFTIIFPQKK